MNDERQKIIYTIGHSTRTQQHFVEMLQSFSIEVLIDIRSYPGSKRYPHFNKENLETTLPMNLEMQYKNWKQLLLNKELHTCAQRLYGGVVTVH